MQKHKKLVRFYLPLIFPEGVSPGDGANGNVNVIAHDGEGMPVLRGTAMAGALRQAYAYEVNLNRFTDEVNFWFGAAANDKANQGREISRVIIPDTKLECGDAEEDVRMHNAIDRHTGAVREHSLFQIQSLPPGVNGDFWFDLVADDIEEDKLTEFVQTINQIFCAGLFVGGNQARGIGFAELITEKAGYSIYDLAEERELKRFLNEDYQFRKGSAGITPEVGFAELPVDKDDLNLTVNLTIPRGQDVLIGDSVALDYDIQMQRTKAADGRTYWRLPGSAFKGVFRSWVNRLATLEGLYVADNLDDYENNGPFSSDDLAWARPDNEDERKQCQEDPSKVVCKVAGLFGSLYSKSRTHFRDILIAEGDAVSDSRMHVALDAISGGAHEGALFSNNVLAGNSKELILKILVREPEEQEVNWLKKTLVAIDSGIIRIGSSKAAGRLGIESVNASGPFNETFNRQKWAGKNPYESKEAV